MQKLPVYLYTNLFDVTLDLDNNRGIHQTMYQRTLKIQKGVRNTVQLQFKNSDQKRIDISTQTFVMNVFNQEDHQLVMTKDLTIIDDGSTSTNILKGLASVTFTESDTLGIDTKSYNFSITKLEEGGSYSPTYSNTYYDVAGVLEVKNEILPAMKPSLAVTNFQRVFNPDSAAQQWEFYSGNIRVNPELQSNHAQHTVAIYMTNFKGSVRVEATQENSPGTYGNYATISTKTYTGFTGSDYVNFNGVFTSVRVKFIPQKDPATLLNTDVNYTGSVDKVLYRS